MVFHIEFSYVGYIGHLAMEFEDLSCNLDWDPSYLLLIFYQDFYDMSELWNASSSISDSDILKAMYQKYSPIIEDISIDDDSLCEAVEAIENQ